MQFNQQHLQALASELVKGIKTEADLNTVSRQLIKLTVETALNATSNQTVQLPAMSVLFVGYVVTRSIHH